MHYLLGIDVGTTNLKAAVFDERGDLHALGTSGTKTHYDEKNRAYYNPGEIWADVAAVIRECLDGLRSSRSVSAVSITSMGESGVALDRHGQPVCSSTAWFDRCTMEQSKKIEQRIGGPRIFRITGLDINPIFSLAKILWMKDHEPEAFHRMTKWLSMADFVCYKLARLFVTDYTLASRTMALDLQSHSWSSELLEAFRIDPSLFPTLLPSGTPIGKVTEQASGETGLLAGTPVVVGGHDHYCGFLSSGSLHQNRVLDSSGTVESVVAVLDPGVHPPETFSGLRIGFFLDPARYTSMGGVLASGASLDWFMKTLASIEGWSRDEDNDSIKLSYEQVLEEVSRTRPGARGILYLPHLRGAGSPVWDPHSRGAVIGLRDTHSPAEVMRAVMEGICFETRMILDTMRQTFDFYIDGVNAIGGGTQNPLWQQIKADILGMSIDVSDVVESASKGAALLAGIGVGAYRDLIDASRKTYRLKRRFEPEESVVDEYSDLYAVYKRIYPALREINTSLDTRLTQRVAH